MRLKVISCILAILWLILPLMGCRSSQQETMQHGPTQPTVTQTTVDPLADYKMPTVDEDYWELLCENYDAIVYRLSSGQRYLDIQLVSARNLQGETVTITSNLGGNVTWSPLPDDTGSPESISKAVFLSYQGIDWASLEGMVTALNGAIAQVSEAYEAARNSLPRLYSYVVTLAVYDLGMKPGRDENGNPPSDEAILSWPAQQLESLSVKIGEETKIYNLDNVWSMPETAADNEGYWGGLSLKGNTIMSDYPADFTKDGILKLKKLRYEATDDVLLQKFTIPGAEVLQCDVKIKTEQGDKFSFRWDCNSPIEVDAGSEISLDNIIMKDPKLANTLFANIWRNQILTYTNNGTGEYAGQEFTAVIPISIRMRVEAWDAYAWYVDGVDMLPYYYEYKNYGE